MLTVQEVRTLADLLTYEKEWNALLLSAPNSSFFLSPEWLTSWIESFWSGRAIRFIFVRKNEKLVGLAPFVEDEAGDLGCRRSLAFPVNLQSHTCDLLMDSTDAAAVVRAVLSHLGANRPNFRLSLRHVDSASQLAPTIAGMARPLGLLTHIPHRTEWAFARLGSSWAEYLRTRAPHVRTEIRRKRKKLEAAGTVEVRCFSGDVDCGAALEDVLHVESRSWKEGEGTSFLTEKGVSAFYEALTRRCGARGWARIYVLYLDSTPIAHVLGVEFGRAYLALKTSYDQSQRALAAGQVLVGHALEDSLNRRLEVFDFLGEVVRWKLELATDKGSHLDLCVCSRKNLACQVRHFAEGQLKPMARRWFPRAGRGLRALGRVLTLRKG